MLKVKLLQIGLLFVLFVGFTHSVQAQNSRDYVGNRSLSVMSQVEQDINRAFMNKDFERISKSFDESVEINFPNKQGTFSKSQARFVLKEFFSDYPAIGFEHSFAGVTSSKSSRYTIGDYKTTKATYQVKVSYKNKDGFWLIDNINISQK